MSTDFFQRQERARRNTVRLVILFIIAVLALMGLTYFPAFLVFKQSGGPNQLVNGSFSFWEPSVLAVSALTTLTIVGLGSTYKISQLSGGGKAVALLMDGVEIPTNTRHPGERRILNIVEEMAIAAGVPVPPVFLLANENGINAFAAGYAAEDAAVAVSQGCLDYLTRDELQGVVAHEFSHILNGDMRLNIRLVGLIHGLIVLSLVGQLLMRAAARSNHQRSYRSNKNEGGGAGAFLVLGIALYILGLVGSFFGWLMQAAVSRQREFLADASAVQFTRNPEGISGALKKIGGLSTGSQIENGNASEISHMFFASAFRQSIFATHPPLQDRIRAIDSNWNGVFPKVSKLAIGPEPERAAVPNVRRPMGLPGLPQMPLPIPVPRLAGDATVARIGTVPAESQSSAAFFEDRITPEIREFIGEPFTARAVIYALLLHADPEIRMRQFQAFRAASDTRDVDVMLRHEEQVRAIPPGTRLAVAHFAMPTLRTMSLKQYQSFRTVLDEMIRADGRVSLFEYCLRHLVTRYLDRAYGLAPLPSGQPVPRRTLIVAAEQILGLLAAHGHTNAPAADAAFTTGLAEWHMGNPAVVPARGQASLKTFTEALDQFAEAPPRPKERLIRAATACIVADRVVTATEYEMLRTICAALDCPFPPLGPNV